MNIDTAYHLTTKRNWKKIQRSGFLKPKTYPLHDTPTGQSDLARLIDYLLPLAYFPRRGPKNERYTYCFPQEERPNNWKDDSEYYHVAAWVAGPIAAQYRPTELVQLKIRLEETDQAFVLDWDAGKWKYWSEPGEYMRTKVHLLEYRGDYILPELIIANPIPVNRIEMAGVLRTKTYDQIFKEQFG